MDSAKMEILLYMLSEATINIQAILMSVITNGNNDNHTTNNVSEQSTRVVVNLVLPFITALLKQLRPM